jgi:hypothetical protein
MNAILIVPPVLLLNTMLAWSILQRFSAYARQPMPIKMELLNRISGCCFQLYLIYSGFYLTSDEAVNAYNQATTGYMLYDLAFMSLHSKTWPMYFHHGFYIVVYLNRVAFAQEYHTKFAQMTWLLESSSPLLTLTWTLHTFEYPLNQIHKTTRILCFIYWSLTRVIIFPYFIYTWGLYMIGIPFYLLQLYWFKLLLRRIK